MCVRSILLINASWNVFTNWVCNSKSIKSLGLLFSSNGGRWEISPPLDAWQKEARGTEARVCLANSHWTCPWLGSRTNKGLLPPNWVLERVLCGTHFSICKKNSPVLVSLVSSYWNLHEKYFFLCQSPFWGTSKKNCFGSWLNCEASGYQRAGFPWEYPGNSSLSFSIRC